jgi:hypothetical protein
VLPLLHPAKEVRRKKTPTERTHRRSAPRFSDENDVRHENSFVRIRKKMLENIGKVENDDSSHAECVSFSKG